MKTTTSETTATTAPTAARASAAEILQEYGPFPGAPHVHGLTYDGRQVWFAAGDSMKALDPETGTVVRSLDVAAHAGTAYDGTYFYQIAEDRIHKIDSAAGRVVGSIALPAGGC